ncbi:response regulator transcription factor [Haloferula sp. BvORR071]|uniref:response regulator transcription factor n=1 Tax=Haloferula sp. BvORR071 TaxID=1396141 RepID=UPI0005556AF5|nr:response regulator transcription factor [Haloferula sp. BvORR071]
MTQAKRSIAIVEDDSALRESFREALNASDTWRVIGCYGRAESALPAIQKELPDACLMDIQLPGISGIQLLRKLKPLCPNTQFLMVTVFEDADRVFEALAAGASGYVLKKDIDSKLLESLDDVVAGGSPMSSGIARKVVQHFQIPVAEPDEDYHLTAREKETLDLLAKGYLYKEIAHEMGVRMETVSFHLGNIYRKLHVRTRTEAVLKYMKRDPEA